MLKYLLKRTLIMLPQIVLLGLVIFFLSNHAVVGEEREPIFNANLLAVDSIQDMFAHIMNSVHDYFTWLGGFLQGDWGRSRRFQLPVMDLIRWRLYNTVYLSILALGIMYMMAIPMALICAKNNGKWKERLLTSISYVGFAVPMFTFTLLAIYIFAFRLRWLPSGGSVPPGMGAGMQGYWLARLRHMILPAFCIAAVNMAPTFHYLKTEMTQMSLHLMSITARAKGCSESRVYNKHIFRNSLLPITASFGYQMAALLGGTIFVEMLFSYPGMGVLLLTALRDGDQAVIGALGLMYASATIIGSCLSDVMTAWVDPRIRLKS